MNILITGATGVMGRKTVDLLLDEEVFNIKVFSLDTRKDKKIINNWKNLDVFFGDLTNYQDCYKAMEEVDIVLHMGAMVSPMADKSPEATWNVNYKGTKNLIDAIIERGYKNRTKFVFIGSVAQTGNRHYPYHWGRVGDPIMPSVYDYYALSKVAAEKYVVESGLKYWVSLRQTGILGEEVIKNKNDGIMYHQPLNNHLEWVSVNDSAKLMLSICKTKEDVWKNIYNIGGGEEYRIKSKEFIGMMMNSMFQKTFDDFYDEDMFASRNFHGQWYFDSDDLNNKLQFRKESINDLMKNITNTSFNNTLVKVLPSKMVKWMNRYKQVSNDNTPLYWKDKDFVKWNIFCGEVPKEGIDIKKVNHGFDNPLKELTKEDVKKIAIFRGGTFLSKYGGNLFQPKKWKCSEGHIFKASVFLIARGGHWCHKCMLESWNYAKLAIHNKHLAQVWRADHTENIEPVIVPYSLKM